MTLMEVMVTMSVISVLVATSATSIIRTIEHVNVDYAEAGLRTIWNSQRLYWLEHRQYADDMDTLRSAGLIDNSLDSSRFAYEITAADANSFVAGAERTGSTTWAGTLAIDESGAVTGSVSKGAYVIEPGS